jgi:hypothetical protein
MILAFADDSTVTAVDDIAEANGYCEGVDVEAGIFTFVDEHGTVLRPIFTRPVTRSTLGPVSFVSSGHFTLVPTDERRPDLLQAVFDGHIAVGRGPRIRTHEELIMELRPC